MSHEVPFMPPSLNRIAYYRDRCAPPLTQATLARALGKHVNTIQLWEKQGVPSAADLLRLATLFVERRAIMDYETALKFWELSGRESFPAPLELRRLFHTAPRTAAVEWPTDILPPSGPLPHGSLLALRRNRLFVGRLDELRALAAALESPDTTAVITGIAGMGKTQLACEFAHRYGQFFSGGVFWISFADPGAVPAGIAACGGAEHLNLWPDFDTLPLDKQVRLVLAAWRDVIPRLLVFDNCEDQDLLAEWRPPTGGCRVLVTSRRARWNAALVGHVMQLQPLGRAESIALLRGHGAGLPAGVAFGGPAADADFDAIAAELGDLPLALHLAGAYLAYRYPGLEPARYLAELRGVRDDTSRPENILEHASLQGGDASPTRHHQHLALALALSYHRLRPVNPVDMLARELLARAAYFAPGEPLPRALLLATVAPPDAADDKRVGSEDALARLVGDLGLLELGVGGTLRIHRLVAGFVRGSGGDAAAQEAVELAMLAEGGRLNEQRLPALMLALQAHMRAVTDAACQRNDARAADLCAVLGWQLLLLGAYSDARPYLQLSLSIREDLFGDNHPNTAASLNLIGLLHQFQGDLAIAQPFFERALAIWEQTLGPDHGETAAALNNLGNLLWRRGQYALAQPYFERSLEINLRVYGLDHSAPARVLNNLGYLFLSQGQYANAQEYFERALAIREKVHPANHPSTAQTLNNLGDLFLAQKDFTRAHHYYTRSLAMRQVVFGSHHVDIAESLRHLGHIQLAYGDFAGAQQYYERALAISAALTGADSLESVWNLDALGDVFFAKQEDVVARSYYERALAIFEAHFIPDHHNIQRVRQRLAEIAQRAGGEP
jgi:Tfp pilus assembly protein PilF